MTSDEICTFPEIGERLERERQKKKPVLSYATLSEGITADATSIFRWLHGQNAGNCVQIVQLGVKLGLRPDQVFLRDPNAQEEKHEAVFTNEDFDALRQIRDHLKLLTRFSTGPKRPTQIVAEHVHSVVEALHLNDYVASQGLPPGTVISGAPDLGAGGKLYEPPPSLKSATRASESAAGYGKTRHRKKKQ